MKYVVLPTYQYLVDAQNYAVSEYQVHYYYDQQEMSVVFAEKIKPGQQYCVIGSMLAPVQEQMLLLQIMYHISMHQGLVILFSPYLGYARQTDESDDILFGTRWAQSMLEAAGANTVLTFDMHAPMQSLVFEVVNVSLDTVYQQELMQCATQGYGLIFPDKGAAQRNQVLEQSFAHVGYFAKKRDEHGVQLTDFSGVCTTKVAIVDDIIDTGGTLLHVVLALQELGVEDIVIFVTHGFFQGADWLHLFDYKVTKIYCTNSTSQGHNLAHDKVFIHPIIPYQDLQKYLAF